MINVSTQIYRQRQGRQGAHTLNCHGQGRTEELSHSGLRARPDCESHRLNICRLWWLLSEQFNIYLRKTDYCNTEEPKAKLATIFHKSHTQYENASIYWAFLSLSPAYNLVREVGRNLGKPYMSWLLKSVRVFLLMSHWFSQGTSELYGSSKPTSFPITFWMTHFDNQVIWTYTNHLGCNSGQKMSEVAKHAFWRWWVHN